MKIIHCCKFDAVHGGDAAATWEGTGNNSWGEPQWSKEVTSICTTTQLGPLTQQDCLNSDGTRTVQSCISGGPSVSVGGVGIGAQVNACSTISIR
jgi:hypothetical protein